MEFYNVLPNQGGYLSCSDSVMVPDFRGTTRPSGKYWGVAAMPKGIATMPFAIAALP